MRKAAAAVALALLAGCSGGSVDLGALSSASDQIVWDAAQKAVERKEWANARQYYKRIVDAFPQSEHQPDARIGLADSYFEEGGTGNYVLAVSAYREFLTLYPQHPRSDYAQFRAAESYFKQKNSPDRDQTATEQALEEYQRLLRRLPRLQVCRVHAPEDPRMPADAGPLALPRRLLLPARAAGVALGHRPVPDHRQRLPRLRQARRGALPPLPVPRGRRPLRRGASAPLPARRYPGGPFVTDGQKLRAEFPPSFTPAAPTAAPAPAGSGDAAKAGRTPPARTDGTAPADPPKPAVPAPAGQPAVRERSRGPEDRSAPAPAPFLPTLKCHFDESRKNPLTTALFS